MYLNNKQTGVATWIIVVIIAVALVLGGVALYQSGRNSTYDNINFEGFQENTSSSNNQGNNDDQLQNTTISSNSNETITLMMPVINDEGGMQNAENAGISYQEIPQSWRDQGLWVGCGVSVVYLPVEVPYTQAVLNATYEYLFAANPVITYQGESYSNLIGRYAQNTDLPFSFESVDIVGTTAQLHLTGTIMNNHCADPAIMAQMKFAATQYPTVDNLEIYLNGQLFDVQAWYGTE